MAVAARLWDHGTMTSPFSLTHIGGPTLLIEIGSLRLLTDPTFDASGRSYTIPRTGSVVTKLVDPALPAASLGRVDAVLLSHDEHADNLDDAGRALLERVAVTYTTTAGAGRLGGSAHGLAPWQSAKLGDITITATPGRHGPPGCEPLLGDVIGFVLEWSGGGALYISGDTVWYEELEAIGRRFAIDTAILHLGRVERPDGTRFTMSASDGADAARKLGAKRIVPIHYEGWQHFSEGREAAHAAFVAAGLAESTQWLDLGHRVAFTRPDTLP
jgi:L-ascorbate metabolism protein UlaG (beta-lactamase superfamily)